MAPIGQDPHMHLHNRQEAYLDALEAKSRARGPISRWVRGLVADFQQLRMESAESDLANPTPNITQWPISGGDTWGNHVPIPEEMYRGGETEAE